MTNETTTLTEQQDNTEARRKLALLKAVGLDRVPPEQRELALAIAKRYDLDLMLKHLVLVDGRPYVTRDALLHIAHRSGQFDGLEVTEPVLDGDYWRSEATVYRKDMSHPFVYPGRYPVKGRNKDFGPEMAIKVAEVMALRRAFDVSAPIVEERWDRDMPEAPVERPPATLRERVEQKRAQVAPGNGPAPAPIVEDDSEPEAILGDPMTVEASAATFAPAMCGAEDKGLDTGECELFTGHQGPHRNAGGVWPNR